MSCPRACEPTSAAKLQTRALGIACHAPELASPCSEDTCDCYPLGLRPRRQHSMPHHLGTVGSGFFKSQASTSQRRTATASISQQSFVIIVNIRPIIFKTPTSSSGHPHQIINILINIISSRSSSASSLTLATGSLQVC